MCNTVEMVPSYNMTVKGMHLIPRFVATATGLPVDQ